MQGFMLLVIEVRKLLVSLDIGQDEGNASETFSVKRNNVSEISKKILKDIFSEFEGSSRNITD